MTWVVVQHPDAQVELSELPTREQVAMRNVMEKLAALGPALPFPHSSQVQQADRLRELRPRAGRSAWRAFYRRIGGTFVIGAVGPEADDKRGFDRAVRTAEDRLNKIEAEEE